MIYIVAPLSTTKFCPVIDLLTASVRTASAQSYGHISIVTKSKYEKRTSTVASLGNLVAFLAASRLSSGNFIPHSVNINPGLTEFTLTFGAAMTASALLRWIAAALGTEYGKDKPVGLIPANDAVVIKAPSFFSSSDFAAWKSQRCALTL